MDYQAENSDVNNVGQLSIRKVLFDEYDVEIAWLDRSHIGTLSVVQRVPYVLFI